MIEGGVSGNARQVDDLEGSKAQRPAGDGTLLGGGRLQVEVEEVIQRVAVTCRTVSNFLEQTAVVLRREESASGEPPKIAGERLEASRSDALLLQLRSFADAVRSRTRPVADGEAGLAALRTALRVRDAMPALDELE